MEEIVYEAWSKTAQSAIDLAERDARGTQHSGVYGYHLLIGLTLEQNGIANAVLREHKVFVADIRRTLNSIAWPNDAAMSSLISQAEKRSNSAQVTSGSLLLELLEGENAASRALQAIGVSIPGLRQATVQTMKRSASQPFAAGKKITA